VTIDFNYDDKCRDGFYRGNVSLDPAASNSDKGLVGLYRSEPGDNYEANAAVMAWSLGPDGKGDSAGKATDGFNKDNVLSWFK
jgi:hypothetical protein